MAKYTGTISKNDLEGGFWELKSEDGENYQLDSKDAGLLVEGNRVVIEGSINKDAFGIGMTGPTLAVTSWTSA